MRMLRKHLEVGRLHREGVRQGGLLPLRRRILFMVRPARRGNGVIIRNGGRAGLELPDDESDLQSNVGTVKTNESNVTSRTDRSQRLRDGFTFILTHKGTKNAKVALDLANAKRLGKAAENQVLLAGDTSRAAALQPRKILL